MLLVHNLRGRRSADTVRAMTEQLWYPLWDAGFVTGHGARTVKESIALADDDLDALTALLDVRVIAGARELAVELERKARELAARRAGARAAGARRRGRSPPAAARARSRRCSSPTSRKARAVCATCSRSNGRGWALGAPGGAATLIEREFLTRRRPGPRRGRA